MYGPTCREELEVLKEEIARRSGRQGFRELENPSVFLCIYCQKLLLKKKRLKAELQEINRNIDSKLGMLTEKTPRARQITEQEASSRTSPDIIVSFNC